LKEYLGRGILKMISAVENIINTFNLYRKLDIESFLKSCESGVPCQVDTTYSGSPINNITKGLPKSIESICPECNKVIPARIFEDNGKVYMEKTCPDHGYVKDLYWSDVELYLKVEKGEFGDGRGLMNPYTMYRGKCPNDCGICGYHSSHTALCMIDLTNRSNLPIPIYLRGVFDTNKIYEITKNQIQDVLQLCRAEKPVACRMVQFSGGEPTIHPEFFKIIEISAELGYSHIEVNSNGIEFAKQDFAERAAKAGLQTVYLHFDSVDDELYVKIYGKPMMEIKKRAIKNIAKAGMEIVLMPTIVGGLNENQVGKILYYALENINVISGIDYRPVSFVGHISAEERERMRFTLPDLVRCVEKQTGIATKKDWYPISFVTPVSKIIKTLGGAEALYVSCHPHCSLGTLLFIEHETGRAIPITQFIDLVGMFNELNNLAVNIKVSRFKRFATMNAFYKISKYFKRDKAPKGMDFTKFLQTIDRFYDTEKDGSYLNKTLGIVGMHPMDSYNYELDRVRRCVFHYATPTGKIIPFCAYHSGHVHQNYIRNLFSVSKEQYDDNLVEKKQISFSEACKIARKILEDAEERRIQFAEEEAKHIAVWEDENDL